MAIDAVMPITRYLNGKRRIQRHNHKYEPKKGKAMKENNNRVLSRQNARELTPAEVDHVTGNINTLTICSQSPKTGTNDCDTLG
ncbi:MAG TPA: hypothetical protein VGR76_08230 [Candidatus Angelobacter sp.]|nr:hypothetical protein [Candidatus Angelobacter sp.]